MKEILIDYLIKNCRGYENRQKAYQLMKIVNIQDHKTFRALIEEIRQDENEIFICSEAGRLGGYYIPTEYEEVQDTLNHLYKRSMEMLKTYSILKNKCLRHGIERINK